MNFHNTFLINDYHFTPILLYSCDNYKEEINSLILKAAIKFTLCFDRFDGFL